jgi:hypothetical protein
MFRTLAARIAGGGGPYGVADMNEVLTEFRPSQLEEYLEDIWRNGLPTANTEVEPEWARGGANPGAFPLDGPPQALAAIPLPGWHHISYAYLLECTRITEIMRQVVYEYAHGERLPLPQDPTRRWARVTEELFFSARPGSLLSLTSHVRPDAEAIRRNAYYRLLGSDLVTGSADGRPYPYVKPEAANRDFSTMFEALMIEAWRGYVNLTNFNNENLTDDDAIATLARRLGEMLRSRRLNGALNREEFSAVALLSWCHLTIEDNTAVVLQLDASAGGISDRLRRIGSLVGVASHSLSDSFIQLAEPVSNILTVIETAATLGVAIPAGTFYAGFLQPDMLNVVTHWSTVSGRNLKALATPLGASTSRLVSTSGRSMSGNGSYATALAGR